VIDSGEFRKSAAPSRLGATRVGGAGLSKPGIRAALSAALAPDRRTLGAPVAEFAARARAMTGHASYTTRQAAYNLRKLRGKDLIARPAGTRRYNVPLHAARTIAALLAFRTQVIAPILAGVRSPHQGRKPRTGPALTGTTKLRISMQALFHDLGITVDAAAA